MRSHVQNGMRKVGYVRISAQRVSKSPSLKTMVASGMKRIDGGTRYARKIARPVGLEPRKRSLSMAYAAKTLAASEVNVDTTDTITVFHIQSGYGVSKIK